ncbi:MAG: YceI family protein, partial [Gemmatimonadales bacterium]
RDRRDQFVQRRTLETDKFPTAVLVPTAVTGLPWPLPVSGPLAFELTGPVTGHGGTRPTTRHVTATAAADGFSGTAATIVTFTGLSLDPPRMGFILSLADTIHLEYDFHLIRGAATGR